MAAAAAAQEIARGADEGFETRGIPQPAGKRNAADSCRRV
jgi:hypothetical protein